MANDELEKRILTLVAQDRIDIPISSMSGKLKRRKPTLGQDIKEEMQDETSYIGERVFAKISYEDKEKARSMKEAVAEFCEEHPKYGDILKGKIAEKRVRKEEHLYFGVNEGRRLTREDYLNVMADMGYSPAMAAPMYEAIIEASRNISRKRNEERSVLIGKSEDNEDSE
jgi:hypothetical protein